MADKGVHVLELFGRENFWTPPEVNIKDIVCKADNSSPNGRYLYIMQTQPYIDSVYIEYDAERNPVESKRFTFHEGYFWNTEDEAYFSEHCIKDNGCSYSGAPIAEIFREYDKRYPDWHIKRYYTKGLRILDHIYNCLKQNTAKEMLYKAGLDELAVHVDEIDELNLLSDKPSDIYDGLSMKVLRSLNCPCGTKLLEKKKLRSFLKELNMKFPDLFKERLNDSQCLYLLYLITGNLTVGETGRLFEARRQYLSGIWSKNYFVQFLYEEKEKEKLHERLKEICAIDPIYEKYIRGLKNARDDSIVQQLERMLLVRRDEYDKAIRRSNRKKDYYLQERGEKYIVRYPQTINDFCREAVYMQNCLLTYIEALVGGDTTILFMREASDPTRPFITIEIYKDELMQAYHRFNEDCTKEEAEWITSYCKRYGIRTGKFKFNAEEDELF